MIEEVKRASELFRNMKYVDKKFLLCLFYQSYPHRPYELNIPYKKIRYTLNKYIEMGILELNTFGWECEITVNFTNMGLYLIDYIKENDCIADYIVRDSMLHNVH